MKKEQIEPELTVEVKEQVWDMTLESEPVLHCALTWPELKGTWKGINAVNRYYSRVVQIWKRRWEREVYLRACLDLVDRRAQGRPFQIWQAKLTTQITCQEGDLLSLFQDGMEQVGYDRPVTVRRGDTWSLAQGAPRTLGSFFPKGRRWKKRVLEQVAEQITHRLAGGESLLDPDCLHRLRSASDPEHFYLTGEGIQVFFPMYVLGPSAEGVPSFDIELPAQ